MTSMNIRQSPLSFRFWLVVVAIVLLTLTACATGPKQTIHAFTFDGWFDKWATEVDLLEYSYGNQYHMVQDKVQPTKVSLGYKAGVNGPMPVGEFLYVKWRIKSTKEVVERKVDLRDLLSRNMYEHKVTFVIEGRQLYVYLVTPQFKKDSDPPHLKTYLSDHHVSYEIYPTNTYKQ